MYTLVDRESNLPKGNPTMASSRKETRLRKPAKTSNSNTSHEARSPRYRPPAGPPPRPRPLFSAPFARPILEGLADYRPKKPIPAQALPPSVFTVEPDL